MRKMRIKNYLKIGILLFGVLLLNRACAIEEGITENLTNIKYQSVNSNEATNFINSPKSKSLFNKTENGLNLNIDIKSLKFEKIKNSDLSMPLFQATTKNSNIKTEVFLIKINDSIHGFLLNRIPKKDFNTSKFSGIISITNLNGHFINGYRVENGVFISQFVRNLSFKSNILLKTQTDPEVACDESLDPNSDFCNNSLGEVTIISSSNSSSTSLNITYTPSIDWTFSTITDTSGGGGTSTSSSSGTVEVFPCDDPIHGCRDYDCPEGYTKNINNECVKIPCIGNPVRNPEIAPQTNSGIQGGLHNTCVRRQDNKICNGKVGYKLHDGVDIKNAFGEPIYAMYDGVAKIGAYQPNGAGYYVGITSTINGNSVRLVFFHMQEAGMVSGQVKAGDIIGYQGDSGNLRIAIKKRQTVSHVHVKAQINGSMANPLLYFGTKIDPNTGQVTNPCN